MKEGNTFLSWVKEHKAELIIAGVTVAGGILILKNWDIIKELLKKGNMNRCESSTPVAHVSDVIPVINFTEVQQPSILKITAVREHPRTLPEGRHPSAFKLAEAAKLSIKLAENQTFVSAHPRCYAA